MTLNMKAKRCQKFINHQIGPLAQVLGLQRNAAHHQSLQNIAMDPNAKSSSCLINDMLESVMAETLISTKGYLPSRKHSCKAIRTHTNHLKSKELFEVEKKQGTRESKSRKMSLSANPSKSKNMNTELYRDLREKMQKYPPLFGRMKSQNIMNQSVWMQDQNLQTKMINFGKWVLWTQKKLSKVVEDFYSFLPRQINQKTSSYDLRQLRRNKQNEDLSMLVVKFLFSKYKTDKLCRENFINLCYSLFYHIKNNLTILAEHPPSHQQILSSIRYYQTFDKIISGMYNTEEAMFYLWSRDIFQKLFAEKDKVTLKEDSQLLFQYLIAIVKGDQELFVNFRDEIVCMSSNTVLTKEIILTFLLQNYKKRSQRPSTDKSINQFQQTVKGRSRKKQCFWKKQMPSQHFQTEFQEQLTQCIHNQCIRLVRILSPELQSKQKELLLQVLRIKTSRLILAIAQRNKNMWFEELCYPLDEVPFQQQLQDLNQLQSISLKFQEVRTSFQMGLLSSVLLTELIKRIMTARIFLQKMEELVLEMEGASNY